MLGRTVGVVLIALLLASLAQGVIVAGQETGRGAGVESVFDDIIARLRSVQALLESVNPSEAARFRDAFEKAVAGIVEAKGRARVDPEGALAEAYRVQVSVLNEVKGVLARANVTYPLGLLVALDVKASMVKDLRATVEYLMSLNVTIDDWVLVKLDETEKAIARLKEGLVTGALNVSQVAVKLGEVNRNISEVRVYLAKTVKPAWLRAHVESFVAREVATTVLRLHGKLDLIARGDPDVVVELYKNLSRLDELLVKLPEIGLPDDLVWKLREVRECKLIVVEPEKPVPLPFVTMAKLLVKVKDDEVKARILVAEIARCLKQPLAAMKAYDRKLVEEARVKASKVEEEATRDVVRILERAPQASIGLVEAEYRELLKLLEAYRKGEVSVEEVRAQAQLVLWIAELAEQVITELPEPAQKPLEARIKTIVGEVNRILEELKAAH